MLNKKYTAKLTAALLLVGASTLPYAVQAATAPKAPLALVNPAAGILEVSSAQTEVQTPGPAATIKLAEGPELLEVMEFEAAETPESH